MESNGFFRDMLDVKILILYAAAQLEDPVDVQTLYEICYTESALDYFDFCYAVPELVQTGHLERGEDGRLSITQKGRDNGGATQDSIPLSVRRRTNAAVEAYKRRAQRDSLISTGIHAREDGDYAVMLHLRDGVSTLMTLELMAPNAVQARRLERAFQKNAESIYQQVMTQLLKSAEPQETP